MAPERSPKRQKTLTSEESSQSAETKLEPAPDQANNESNLTQSPRSSWYSSWSRKAPAVTELARESLQSISPTPSNATIQPESPKPRSIRSPSLAMTLGKKQTNRGLPVDATTTKIHAEATSPVTKNTNTTNASTEGILTPEQEIKRDSKRTEQAASLSGSQHAQTKEETSTESHETSSQRGSWLGWLGKNEDKPVGQRSHEQPSTDHSKNEEELASGSTPQPSDSSKPNDKQAVVDNTAKAKTIRRSWLPWSGDDVQRTTDIMPLKDPQMDVKTDEPDFQIPVKTTPAAISIDEQSKPHSDSIASSNDVAPPPSLPHDGVKPAAWAFWSRERKANSSSTSVDKAQEGEIAISDTPSQGRPKRTSMSIPKADKTIPEAENVTAGPKKVQKEGNKALKIENPDAAAVAQQVPEQKPSTPLKPTKGYQNILLPEVQATLKLPDHPSIIQQLARLLYITKEPELKHLSLVKDPPKIRNALAIGVHGYFPAPFIRTVIGQPTGTSIKFADMASKAIRRWTTSRGYECQVKTAALEGEGKIAERVDLLWKLLLNWIEEIRKSDFVLVACHSQGVPVAIMLVAKLIQFGCLSGARVGICAMAGVNMGPFTDYKSRFIGGSAGELFEFSDPASKVSQDYASALETVLKFGTRLTFIGSIDDQLVSLESSIFASMSHPHIYRAVSIDARLHAPNFLSHLVGFALKLRNLGIQDHGLIRELSSPLAGSLYTGDGHSRIYESDNCYDMAIDWSLLTTSMPEAPLMQRPAISGASNPYILPFAMRGILEEDFVKTELQGEASELLKQFDEWKPTTKVLKDVKFRLEGIRSKL